MVIYYIKRGEAMPQNDLNWYKLDNAARLFPSVSSTTATNVFRLSVRLYEEVNPEFLNKAVIQALDETPSFRVRLRKGLFWYYFENNPAVPEVKEEKFYPCRMHDRYKNRGYLFEITYLGRYIHAEFFHALCDGTGGADFLSKIVTNYLLYSHKDELSDGIEPISEGISFSAQKEDSFLRVARDNQIKPENIVKYRAYNAPGTYNQYGEIKVIKGIFPLSQIKALSKAHNVTITEYLVSTLIYSLYKECFVYEPVNRPIDICVPVNLRKFFPSETSRNFFATISVGVDFYKQAHTFDEVLEIVKTKMKKELDPENIYPKIMYCVNAQDNIILRFIPLFLKNIVLKYTFSKGEKGYSSVLSNLGAFNINKELEPYIERFEFMLSPTLNSRYKTAACSYKDTFVYTFASNSENTEIQRKFFKFLREQGIDVTISSNINDEPELPLKKSEKIKKQKKNRRKKDDKNEVL